MAGKPLRPWQSRCKRAIQENFRLHMAHGEQPAASVAACVAAGKSTSMVDLAYDHLFGDGAEFLPVDFCVFVAPSRGIIGACGGSTSEGFGLLGTLFSYNIIASERITADSRMPGLMRFPEPLVNDAGIITGVAAVFTYQYLRQPRVLDTLLSWAKDGRRIAFFYDEIHHVPEAGKSWSEALARVNAIASFVTYWSGTWFRTDRLAIVGQVAETQPDVTFRYTYAEAITDGHNRPVSFWIPHQCAKVCDAHSGVLIDERPVAEYLEDIPPEILREMFDPDGDFVSRMIRLADEELSRRRFKYPDAGCLIVCPPGFADDDDTEDRIAERIYDRVLKLTGKRAVLVLNGHPVERINEYRDSDIEFVVAVNRVSEGCDIPRLRIAAIIRDIASELLFEQIVGRVIRRRPEDDDEPALVIIPPIHAMCEFARRIRIAQKGAVPKKANPCLDCDRIPCRCPCKQCGKPRPCPCPCKRCFSKPCVCRRIPQLEHFIALEEMDDGHITQGTDIENRFATRADLIRQRVDACAHRDLAGIAYILQCDDEINGPVMVATDGSSPNTRLPTVALAVNWQNLFDTFPAKILRLQRFFRHEDNRFRAAWSHINRKFFESGMTWSKLAKDKNLGPSILTFEKLREMHAYVDRCIERGQL